MGIVIDQKDRNTSLLLLVNKMAGEERWEEIVMLGEIIIGDGHPSILMSYKIITNMMTDERIIGQRNRVAEMLEEHRAGYDKEDNKKA